MIATTLAGLLAVQQPGLAPCTYDRARIMALDQNAFDQDMEGGWRPLARVPECVAVAADLIRDYRALHRLNAAALSWHEGQMRAEAGQSEAAVALFERSRHDETDQTGWNLYVDASIAFLRHDLPALRRAREALAGLPRPVGFAPVDIHGNPAHIIWPLNLNVVDALLACFGQSYAAAYRCPPPSPVHHAGH